jgi:hypothetical protein
MVGHFTGNGNLNVNIPVDLAGGTILNAGGGLHPRIPNTHLTAALKWIARLNFRYSTHGGASPSFTKTNAAFLDWRVNFNAQYSTYNLITQYNAYGNSRFIWATSLADSATGNGVHVNVPGANFTSLDVGASIWWFIPGQLAVQLFDGAENIAQATIAQVQGPNDVLVNIQQARTDSCTVTNGSCIVLDDSIASTDTGAMISGSGFPGGCIVRNARIDSNCTYAANGNKVYDPFVTSADIGLQVFDFNKTSTIAAGSLVQSVGSDAGGSYFLMNFNVLAANSGNHFLQLGSVNGPSGSPAYNNAGTTVYAKRVDTCTMTANANTFVDNNGSAADVGRTVTGSGFVAGTTITNFNSTSKQLTTSNNWTGSSGSASITFKGQFTTNSPWTGASGTTNLTIWAAPTAGNHPTFAGTSPIIGSIPAGAFCFIFADDTTPFRNANSDCADAGGGVVYLPRAAGRTGMYAFNSIDQPSGWSGFNAVTGWSFNNQQGAPVTVKGDGYAPVILTQDGTGIAGPTYDLVVGTGSSMVQISGKDILHMANLDGTDNAGSGVRNIFLDGATIAGSQHNVGLNGNFQTMDSVFSFGGCGTYTNPFRGTPPVRFPGLSSSTQSGRGGLNVNGNPVAIGCTLSNSIIIDRIGDAGIDWPSIGLGSKILNVLHIGSRIGYFFCGGDHAAASLATMQGADESWAETVVNGYYYIAQPVGAGQLNATNDGIDLNGCINTLLKNICGTGTGNALTIVPGSGGGGAKPNNYTQGLCVRNFYNVGPDDGRTYNWGDSEFVLWDACDLSHGTLKINPGFHGTFNAIVQNCTVPKVSFATNSASQSAGSSGTPLQFNNNNYPGGRTIPGSNPTFNITSGSGPAFFSVTGGVNGNAPTHGTNGNLFQYASGVHNWTYTVSPALLQMGHFDWGALKMFGAIPPRSFVKALTAAVNGTISATLKTSHKLTNAVLTWTISASQLLNSQSYFETFPANLLFTISTGPNVIVRAVTAVALTLSGALPKAIASTTYAGALQLIGKVNSSRPLNLSGVLSAAGALKRFIVHGHSATLTWTPSNLRSISSRKTAAVTVIGNTTHSFVRALAGALTLMNTIGGFNLLTKPNSQTAATLIGTGLTNMRTFTVSNTSAVLQVIGSFAKTPNKLLNGTLQLFGVRTIGNSYTRAVSGILNVTGGLLRSKGLSFSAALTTVGNITQRSIVHTISAASVNVGVIVRNPNKALSGTLILTGVLGRAKAAMLASSLIATGVMSRTTNKVLAAVTSFATASVHSFGRFMTVSLVMPGAMVGNRGKALTAALVTASQMQRTVGRRLTASLSLAGLFGQNIVLLIASLQSIGNTSRAISHRLSGVLSFTPLRGFGKAFTGTLIATGKTSFTTSHIFTGIVNIAGTVNKAVSHQMIAALQLGGSFQRIKGLLLTANLITQSTMRRSIVKLIGDTIYMSDWPAKVFASMLRLIGGFLVTKLQHGDVTTVISTPTEPLTTITIVSKATTTITHD